MSDIEDLNALSLASKAHWGYSAAFIAKCQDELMFSPSSLEKEAVLVVANATEILALAGLARLDHKHAEITRFFVAPEQIGKGIGADLMKAINDLALTMGLTSLEVEADPFAAGFYERMGFQKHSMRSSTVFPGRQLPVLLRSIV